MAEIKVDISELKAEGNDVIEELIDFIKEKTNVEVEKGPNEIIIKTDEKSISKQYVRVLLKKYLHRSELKEYFKVIGRKENTLFVKEKKTEEEE